MMVDEVASSSCFGHLPEGFGAPALIVCNLLHSILADQWVAERMLKPTFHSMFGYPAFCACHRIQFYTLHGFS